LNARTIYEMHVLRHLPSMVVRVVKLGPDLFELLNAQQRVGNRSRAIYGAPGLSPAQITSIEAQLGFRLPEDFVYLFQNVQDPGHVFFPWANFKKQAYDDRIRWILEGIEFDIDRNKFWMNRWGKRPTTLSAARELDDL